MNNNTIYVTLLLQYKFFPPFSCSPSSSRFLNYFLCKKWYFNKDTNETRLEHFLTSSLFFLLPFFIFFSIHSPRADQLLVYCWSTLCFFFDITFIIVIQCLSIARCCRRREKERELVSMDNCILFGFGFCLLRSRRGRPTTTSNRWAFVWTAAAAVDWLLIEILSWKLILCFLIFISIYVVDMLQARGGLLPSDRLNSHHCCCSRKKIWYLNDRLHYLAY